MEHQNHYFSHTFTLNFAVMTSATSSRLNFAKMTSATVKPSIKHTAPQQQIYSKKTTRVLFT